jgi:hypothetical protein
MAFSNAGLTLIGGGAKAGNAPQIWSYSTTDAQTTVRAANYFNSVADLLKVNDVILVASATGGTPVLTWSYVNANSGTAVDTVDGLTITSTDSD